MVWSAICLAFSYILLSVRNNNITLSFFSIMLILYGVTYIYYLFVEDELLVLEILRIAVAASLAIACFANDEIYIGIGAILVTAWLVYNLFIK